MDQDLLGLVPENGWRIFKSLIIFASDEFTYTLPDQSPLPRQVNKTTDRLRQVESLRSKYGKRFISLQKTLAKNS